MLTGKEKRYLRSLANTIEPVVQVIGRNVLLYRPNVKKPVIQLPKK